MTQHDETPETDAAKVDLGKTCVPIKGEWVGVSVSKQLELDRNRLRAQLAGVVERCYQAAYDAMTHGTMNYKALKAIRALADLPAPTGEKK